MRKINIIILRQIKIFYSTFLQLQQKISLAKKYNYRTMNGADMNLEQAVIAFNYTNNIIKNRSVSITKNAMKIYDKILCTPCTVDMTFKDIDFILEIIKSN